MRRKVRGNKARPGRAYVWKVLRERIENWNLSVGEVLE